MSIAETTSRMQSTPGRYPVDIRVSVPFLPQPFFVTLVAGRERRGDGCKRKAGGGHEGVV